MSVDGVLAILRSGGCFGRGEILPERLCGIASPPAPGGV
jgi:hypothetical protein